MNSVPESRMSDAEAQAIAAQILNSIGADICRLLRTGITLNKILVNDGDDRWGANCAVSLDTAQELVAEWHTDNPDSATTVDDLELAETWLTRALKAVQA